MKRVNNYPMRTTPFSLFADSVFSDLESNFKQLNEIAKRPKANIIEEDERFLIELFIPGFDKEEISIEVLDGQLKITGTSTSKYDDHENKMNFRLKEFESQSFERNFKLGDHLDHENIEAELKNGILYMTINKIEEVKPEVKKIAIR